EARRIANITGGAITLDSALTYVHYSTWTVYVANLSRNVLVRSSGTITSAANGNSAYIQDNITGSATSFSLINGEFAYLGPIYNSIHLTGQAFISSCSLHDNAM